MVRVLAFAVLLFLVSVSRSSLEDIGGHPLLEHRTVASDQTSRISDAVRQRFELDRAVAKCSFAENLYAYRTLLARFTGPTKGLLEAAADAGRNSETFGPTRPVDLADRAKTCAKSVDRLRAADDRLLALSETIERN